MTSKISFKVPTPPGKAIKTSDLSIINSFLAERSFVIINSEKYFEFGYSSYRFLLKILIIREFF